MTKASEFRGKSEEQLKQLYEENCQKLFQLKNKKMFEKKLENPAELPKIKRDIARILTVLREEQSAKENKDV